MNDIDRRLWDYLCPDDTTAASSHNVALWLEIAERLGEWAAQQLNERDRLMLMKLDKEANV